MRTVKMSICSMLEEREERKRKRRIEGNPTLFCVQYCAVARIHPRIPDTLQLHHRALQYRNGIIYRDINKMIQHTVAQWNRRINTMKYSGTTDYGFGHDNTMESM